MPDNQSDERQRNQQEKILNNEVESLATPDEKSTKGSERDKEGTRISQDMTVYQQ